MKKYFTEEEKRKIEEAVKEAEKTTSGEIVPMVVDSSDEYPRANIVGGILTSILIVILVNIFYPIKNINLFLGLQAIAFFIGYVATKSIPSAKRILIREDLAELRVYRRALEAFYDHSLHETRDRTGILIMLSLLERRVQVLADKGINEKVDKGTWDSIVKIIVDGVKNKQLTESFCQAIRQCGEILTKHFPIKPDDKDELQNKLLIK